MSEQQTSLATWLEAWAGGDQGKTALAAVVKALAAASLKIADRLADGDGAADAAATGSENAGGDVQKKLDVEANDITVAALKAVDVAVVGSEELDDALVLKAGGAFAVAVDPLDGSSNIETNVPVGMIFSVLPAIPGSDAEASFRQPGKNQLAAGFAMFGPQTLLMLTLGSGSHVFTLHRASGQYVLTGAPLAIPAGKQEYAINASNYRHWNPPVRKYIDDCIAGAEGPYGSNFNMRWVASMVADAYRILRRGGVFLYPGDARKGYEQGRLRLVYECNPMAMVIEQAGGAAFDGTTRILDLVPTKLHQRSPLIFGSKGKIKRITSYYAKYGTDLKATG